MAKDQLRLVMAQAQTPRTKDRTIAIHNTFTNAFALLAAAKVAKPGSLIKLFAWELNLSEDPDMPMMLNSLESVSNARIVTTQTPLAPLIKSVIDTLLLVELVTTMPKET